MQRSRVRYPIEHFQYVLLAIGVCLFSFMLCLISKRIYIALETLKFVLRLLNYRIKTVKTFRDNNEFLHTLDNCLIIFDGK
jgi:hypothetical protein